ncbi:MAG: hypothetical protein COV47_00825 [Candidatus Diapherotrites archaeon CG11_big_fil_rev_8_21_14_0_20_37_9]|nr:MAG: hypothetical protein COV47_00825 [Candidatus Diapherotrites archaeon CG11_big_fil_rev_8_21_14_0_20_37_9]
MQKLGAATISNIRFQRLYGVGYKTIAKALGLSPATVFKYAATLPLSNFAQENILASEKDNQIKFAEKFAKEKSIIYPKVDEYFVNLLGHLFFDGSVYQSGKKYVLSYTNSSLLAIKNFEFLIGYCFSLTPSKLICYTGIKIPWFESKVYSKKAYNYLLNVSSSFSTSDPVGVPKIIFDSSTEIKSAFLVAFWDDEGCISNTGCLSGSSNSLKMISDLVKLHDSLGIKCHKLTQKRHKSQIIADQQSNSTTFLGLLSSKPCKKPKNFQCLL